MKRYIRFLAVFGCNYNIIVKFINWCVILLGMSKIEVVIWDLGNVLIGSNTTILPGVVIGDNSKISAMSLVNKDVEANSFYGGIPIRKIA